MCYWENNTYYNVPGYVNFWLAFIQRENVYSIHQSEGSYIERLKEIDFSVHHPTLSLIVRGIDPDPAPDSSLFS